MDNSLNRHYSSSPRTRRTRTLAWHHPTKTARHCNTPADAAPTPGSPASVCAASTLSQILPLLLPTLFLELRRTGLHRALSRTLVGMLYPFQWGDLLSAPAIFTLLT